MLSQLSEDGVSLVKNVPFDDEENVGKVSWDFNEFFILYWFRSDDSYLFLFKIVVNIIMYKRNSICTYSGLLANNNYLLDSVTICIVLDQSVGEGEPLCSCKYATGTLEDF